MVKVLTHLMFQGQAEEAIQLYSSVFKEFEVAEIERGGEGGSVNGGKLKLASVSFAGHEILIFDSVPVHDFSFTPAVSLFVEFGAKEELETAFSKLSQGGQLMMAPDDYGFCKWYTWFADRFGVSWQLILP